MKISCSVENCSHYKGGICYSNRVNIDGNGSNDKNATCCSSFLDKRNYSTLTNNTNSSGCCDCLVCGVITCNFNNNKLCSAETITVSGNNVNLYTETNCNTYQLK